MLCMIRMFSYVKSISHSFWWCSRHRLLRRTQSQTISQLSRRESNEESDSVVDSEAPLIPQSNSSTSSTSSNISTRSTSSTSSADSLAFHKRQRVFIGKKLREIQSGVSLVLPAYLKVLYSQLFVTLLSMVSLILVLIDCEQFALVRLIFFGPEKVLSYLHNTQS